MEETMTIKPKTALTPDERRAVLEQEIQSLEILIDRRTQWLSKPENKRRSTYSSVLKDTREMEEKLDDLREDLIDLKTR